MVSRKKRGDRIIEMAMAATAGVGAGLLVGFARAAPVPPVPPIISALPSSPIAGDTVAFSLDQNVFDSFIWTFGDGTDTTSSAPSASHTYPLAGFYTVECVFISTLRTGVVSHQLVVKPKPPPPLMTGFVSTPQAPNIGTPVTFTANTTGGTSPYTTAWDFGDGTTGTGDSVSHAYVTAGNFTVTETVTDSGTPAQRLVTTGHVSVTQIVVPVSLTMTPMVTSLQVGDTLGVTGTLARTDTAAGIPGMTVHIMVTRASDTPVEATTALTNATGQYAAGLVFLQPGNYSVQAVFNGGPVVP